MNRDVVRQIVNVVVVIFTIAFNSLAEAIPINGQTSAEIATRFQDVTYFLPANYVFSIWGVIYIGMLAFAIFQALPAQRENPRLRKIGYWFVVTNLANCLWLFLFHYDQFAISTVVILVLLVSLARIYLILRDGQPISRAEFWTVRIPMSIYFAWVTVATVANFTYVGVEAGWDGFGIAYETWGVIMLIVAGLIGGTIAVINRDIAYGAVVVWAYAGIVVRHTDVSGVALTAGVMAALVGIGALIAFGMGRSQDRTLTPGRA
ncbi:MAG: tryptophan-rich sensory protein [Anaerolinea sp.]|nr:tryptophan-rich sensory protein [Anaerolinea sp.]